jgi:SNF2 family DNA or RNA helicase
VKTGWNTSDEDEINVRKKRALKEEFDIRNESKEKVFSNFKVKNYLVELRSLDEDTNSCSCADFATNRLGTCKHIEAVKLQFKDSSDKNKKVEIYVDTKKEKVVIAFPKGMRKTSIFKEVLEPFFSTNHELLSQPHIAFPSLQREIEKLDTAHKKRIRVSKFIQTFIDRINIDLQKQENKKSFLADYQNGKRSFEFLKLPLLEYQKEGVLHLAFNQRALLADEMGLGKTVQAIGACVLAQKLNSVKKVLVISPTSLKTEWEEQIKKFTDLESTFIFGSKTKREQLYQEDTFFYLANYEQILYDYRYINEVLKPDIIVLDEAQRIKNWQTKTAFSIKQLRSPYAFVLTGTPLENRIDEVYSIVQFLDPFLFGPLFRFNRDFYSLNERGAAVGYKNIHLLHQKLQPIMLRRKKEDVEGELPPRIVKNYFLPLDTNGVNMYDEYETVVSRLAAKANKYPLTFDEMKRLQMGLACMRMLCSTPYILNPKIKTSPKIDEIVPIIEEILEKKENKIIIFSEWVKMLELLAEKLEEKEIQLAWHTGEFNQLQRREEINKFKEDEECRVFLLSDSGSVGLNLQVANTVINLDMPWNPAKLEQRIARAWRKHQKRPVQVINLITKEKIEERVLHIVEQKQHLSDNVLDGLGADKLDLPSGKKALLKDLEKLNIVKENEEKKSEEPYNSEHFIQDCVAVYSDRVDRIDANGDNIFVVVDKKDEKIEEKITSIASSNIDEKQVHILSKKELALIEKLTKLGLITPNENVKQLYSTNKKEPMINIKKAKETYNQAKRHYDMATLLKNGGFTEESTTPFSQSKALFLKFLSLLQGNNDEKISSGFVENILVPQYDLSKDIEIEELYEVCSKEERVL